MMSHEVMEKLPSEMIAMFKRTGEILSEIEIVPLNTYSVNVRGDSIFVERNSS